MGLPEPTTTVANAIAVGSRLLRDAGSPTPRLDAELLLAHVLGQERTWLLAHPEASVGDEAAYRALLERRAADEPVAYLRGFKEWRSLRIRTDARALVPRPETELLLEAAIEEISARMARDDATIVAWEVATGSGAVATALALRYREALALGRLRLIASDLSPDALELAAENLAAHGVEKLVDLACADLLSPAGVTLPRPDVVIANLPYVSSEEVDARGGSFKHEPRIALDGGADGLVVLRRLMAELSDGAAPGGVVLLEIGIGQEAAVARTAPVGAATSTVPDLAGIGRVVRIGLPA